MFFMECSFTEVCFIKLLESNNLTALLFLQFYCRQDCIPECSNFFHWDPILQLFKPSLTPC